VIRRLALSVPILIGVIIVIFLVIDLAPGDPATSKLGPYATQEQRKRFAEENDLDAPIPVRFGRFMGDLVQGDLGEALVEPAPVVDLIARRAPVTLQLTALAALLAVVSAVAAGLLAAVRKDGWLDRVLRSGAAAGLAAPDFWVGLIAIQVIALSAGLLPAGGYVALSDDPIGWIESLILPASVLALPVAAALTLVIRASVIDELEKDYVRTALGAGLPKRVIFLKNVLKNALIAPLTVLGLRIGYLLSGAIVIEAIFALPGLGALLLDAVNQGDIAVIQGVALVGTLSFVLVNLIVDVLYLVLNPKLREV
jgi:peptide/nickel transport system permease protein